MAPKVMHMLHELEIAPGQHGVTVRKGFKWADATGNVKLCVCSDRCLSPATCSVPLVSLDTPDLAVAEPRATMTTCTNCAVQGTGQILGAWVGKFEDIPARWIRNEHERSSRNYDGLLESMQRAYPGFHPHDFVTVLLYRRQT